MAFGTLSKRLKRAVPPGRGRTDSGAADPFGVNVRRSRRVPGLWLTLPSVSRGPPLTDESLLETERPVHEFGGIIEVQHTGRPRRVGNSEFVPPAASVSPNLVVEALSPFAVPPFEKPQQDTFPSLERIRRRARS